MLCVHQVTRWSSPSYCWGHTQVVLLFYYHHLSSEKSITKLHNFFQFFTFDRKYLFHQKSSFLVLVCSKNFIFFAKMINGHKNKEAYCYCCGNKIAVSQFLQTSHICMFTVSLLCSNPCQQTGGTDRISSSMSAWIVLIT